MSVSVSGTQVRKETEMAQDVIEMEAEKMTCPHCGKPVLMRWQQAYYGGGESNAQFIGLEKDVPPKVLCKDGNEE